MYFYALSITDSIVIQSASSINYSTLYGLKYDVIEISFRKKTTGVFEKHYALAF